MVKYECSKIQNGNNACLTVGNKEAQKQDQQINPSG